MIFQEILTLEHSHALEWLSITPCPKERHRQIFCTDSNELARYFRLLETTCVNLIFDALSTEDLCSLFYRFSLSEAAQIILHLEQSQGRDILKLLDQVTVNAICIEMEKIRMTLHG
ncbi:hypothetical protein ACLMPM_24210 [Yersinia enterocolitica]|uniref:hypothetical protein n=1 Tax=Yersinia enterocolitica TaxID=630 RepID=UPI00398CDE35